MSPHCCTCAVQALQLGISILDVHGDGGGNTRAQEEAHRKLDGGSSDSFFHGIAEQLKDSSGIDVMERVVYTPEQVRVLDDRIRE